MGKKNRIKATVPERIFTVFNYLFMAFLAFIMIAPLLNLAAKSVSKESVLLRGEVGLLPDFSNLQFDSYKMVFENSRFINSFTLTILVTLVGSVAALIVTATAAYTVSKPWLRGRRFLMLLCIFIMVFSGGMIPTYLIVNMLKLTNTFTVLWILGVFSVYNMLIIKNSYETIPLELEESARIDGAGQFTIFFRIYVPVSKAVYAVIILFNAVGYWNNFFTSMLYTTKIELRTLQYVLKEIIYSASDVFLSLYGNTSLGEVTFQSVIAGCVFVAIVPILLVYPFLQKHFAKGVMTGSVKG